METKLAAHTPGPWKVLGTEVWSQKTEHRVGKIIGCVGGSYGEKDRAIRQLNARLIASAPALLDTAIQVHELIEPYVDITDGVEGQPRANNAMQAVRLLQAAIREAEGG